MGRLDTLQGHIEGEVLLLRGFFSGLHLVARVGEDVVFEF